MWRRFESCTDQVALGRFQRKDVDDFGRAAKERLAQAGLGIQGNIVRSPKSLLGRDSVFIEGTERSPVDIVAEVVSHVFTVRIEREVAAEFANGGPRPEATTEAELESLVRQARRKQAKTTSAKRRKKRH